jgi:ferredoxin
MIIDCDRCEARGLACGNCAATVIVGEPELGPAELRALTVLANAGLIPTLRYAPRMAKAS